METSWISIPRPATSVATRISLAPALRLESANSLCSWPFPPCSVQALYCVKKEQLRLHFVHILTVFLNIQFIDQHINSTHTHAKVLPCLFIVIHLHFSVLVLTSHALANLIQNVPTRLFMLLGRSNVIKQTVLMKQIS